MECTPLSRLSVRRGLLVHVRALSCFTTDSPDGWGSWPIRQVREEVKQLEDQVLHSPRLHRSVLQYVLLVKAHRVLSWACSSGLLTEGAVISMFRVPRTVTSMFGREPIRPGRWLS